MTRQAIAVCRKEFRQIVRDRRTLLILLFVPAFFLLLWGLNRLAGRRRA